MQVQVRNILVWTKREREKWKEYARVLFYPHSCTVTVHIYIHIYILYNATAKLILYMQKMWEEPRLYVHRALCCLPAYNKRAFTTSEGLHFFTARCLYRLTCFMSFCVETKTQLLCMHPLSTSPLAYSGSRSCWFQPRPKCPPFFGPFLYRSITRE